MTEHGYHAIEREVWAEYDRAAEHLAKQGLTGKDGDPLPDLISTRCKAEIDADPEAFQRRIREMAYGLAMESTAPAMPMPTCDMTKDCKQPVTHLDTAGYVYCTAHGLERRSYEPCRKLRPFELRRLARGEQIQRY